MIQTGQGYDICGGKHARGFFPNAAKMRIAATFEDSLGIRWVLASDSSSSDLAADPQVPINSATLCHIVPHPTGICDAHCF